MSSNFDSEQLTTQALEIREYLVNKYWELDQEYADNFETLGVGCHIHGSRSAIAGAIVDLFGTRFFNDDVVRGGVQPEAER